MSTQEQQKQLPADFTYGSIPDPKRAKRNARDVFRGALSEDPIFNGMRPYLTNGIVSGHKVLDLYLCLAIIMQHDGYAQQLKQFNMNDWALCQHLKSALREKLHLNRAWKIDGYAPRLLKEASNDDGDSGE